MKMELDKDCFIFGNYMMGIKGLAYNTEMLLVNNIPDNTVDLIYAVEGKNQVVKINKNDIKDITSNTRVKIQNIGKKAENNETKSMLLSAALFGGNPILQMAGAGGFNSLFDSLSNNYNKVNLNTVFEITIELNGDNKMYVLNTEIDPEEFINKLKNES